MLAPWKPNSEKNKKMTEKHNSDLGWTFGLAFLIGTFALGPIDFPRTVYNTFVGDTPLIKNRLTAYVREGIKRENLALKNSEIEQMLASELRVNLENGDVNPQNVAMERLWDASEDYAKSEYQRWVWPTLDNDYHTPHEENFKE